MARLRLTATRERVREETMFRLERLSSISRVWHLLAHIWAPTLLGARGKAERFMDEYQLEWDYDGKTDDVQGTAGEREVDLGS